MAAAILLVSKEEFATYEYNTTNTMIIRLPRHSSSSIQIDSNHSTYRMRDQ